MTEAGTDYPCVGVCLFDPDSGVCQGCNRPPWPLPINTPGIDQAGDDQAIASGQATQQC